MKIKERALSLLLSLVMVLTFMPALAFAEGEKAASDVQLLPGILWMDCEYGQYPDFSGSGEAVPTRVISSNTAVIEARIDDEATSLWDITLEPISLGKSTITVYYNQNGAQGSTSAEYTVVPFPAFANSLTVDGKPVDLSEYHNYYHQYKYTDTKPVIKYSVADGWEITNAYYFLDDGNDGFPGYTSIDEENLTDFASGIEFDFPQNYEALRVFVDFNDKAGNTVMHSVQLERGEGYDPYDPGESELDRGEPISAVFTLGESCDQLRGETGSTYVENLYQSGNKFTVSYEGGEYPTIDYVCVIEPDPEGGYSAGFYPFGDTSYYMSQLYTKEDEIIVSGSSSLKKGTNNAKIRISFAHDEEEAATEPEIYADITVLGYSDHEHVYGELIREKSATCTESGLKAHYECSECGSLFVLEDGEYVEKTTAELTIPAFGHKWGEPSYKWADDNSSIKASHKCSVCEEEETENGTVTSKVTTSPSCTQKGKTTYTATFTKEGFETKVKEVENIDALGHDEDEGLIKKRATATEEGEMTYKCKRCNQVVRTEVIAALGEDHTPVNQAAEEAIAAVDDASTDTAAAAEAQGAANQAVSAAEQALAAAEASGDSAAINAAKQDVADAKATEAKANAVVAKVAANKSKATAAAKQSAAAAQASTGTDAAVAAAQDAVIAANAAKMDANKAVAAAELAVAAANATNDPAAIEAAGKALNAARTAANAAANAEVAAQTTFAMAVAAKNAAASAAAAAAAPVEIIDLPTVKISKPAAAKKKITVKWKKVSKKNLKKISGIQIQVATDPGFTNIVKTATAGKKKTSKAIKGLQSKTKYYVRIRAYAAGDHYSAWKSKSAKVK